METLEQYLSGMGLELSFYDRYEILNQIPFVNGGIKEGLALSSSTGLFNNLVGKYLTYSQSQNPRWGATKFNGNNCSPTTFNRVDKAMEYVYGNDVLGKMLMSNSLYSKWQGKGNQFAAGVLSALGYGNIIDENSIRNGLLSPGAVLRLSQTPGPDGTGVSWHAAIFLHYNRDSNGRIIGLTYWHQVPYPNKSYTATSTFGFNNQGVYNFSRGYQTILGTNFK
ncbi:hypothetical protein AAG747_25265 [Rapidithrix thailandica]|uniref:Uncharacterized protein n=1 Tax=Rapidithrix thailandica TaxID=413964 RepID=A0AAW9SJ21_9BACT